ncbi:uncharacterized protein C8orf76 homolog [Littorina saxatilis]|uniref:Uncharacterized protein n=1 Tax=Littorina saxatilis TaxID=31220 RepID=A0AAN9B9N6_9CAEN
MDLGLGFDDSDFERKEKITAGTKTSYNAKVCNPLWFETEGEVDPDKYTLQLKYSADYHFHQGNYETAAMKYEQLLELIPMSNMPMRQDVQESLCRSYTKLGRHKDSTDIAFTMVEQMRREDDARQRQSLLLLSQACKAAQDWTGCICALEELASRQSQYAPFWLELGRAYLHCFKDRGDSLQHLPQIVTCFVRARILLASVLHTVGKVAREKSETIICKIDAELQELDASQKVIDQAKEATRSDIEYTAPADDEEDSASANKTQVFNSDAFRKRWFSWTDKLDKT